ncbi:hypothetical protein ACL1FJ_00680 [Corynebacterium striatum]
MADLTSAYGNGTLTVDQIVKDPTWLQERTLENLDGAFLEEALFRNGGTNDGVVAYREAASPYLNDDSEEVAEFAEIPVSEPSIGQARTLIGVKTGLAIRISREMRRENKIDQLSLRQTALQNTMIKNSVESTLEAFRKAGIQNQAVSTDWETDTAKPLRDILTAKRSVNAARPDNSKPNQKFGYSADSLVISEAALDLLLWHDDVQRMYNGNAAIENPLYKGITPATIAGLRVITNPWLKDDEMYILQSGVAGFISDTDPLTVTSLYSESGENGHGGSRQSWRMDAFRKRIIAVDNPKAVVKLSGFTKDAH